MMKYQKLKFFILTVGLFFCMSTMSLHAQDEVDTEEDKQEEKDRKREREDDPDRIPLSERLVFGGNFQLSFGDITIIDVSPTAAVQLNERTQVGVGITYQYYRQKAGSSVIVTSNGLISYPDEDYQTSIYGGRLFGRYFPVPTMFGHAEAEVLSYSYENAVGFGYERRRAWVPGVFVGGGYSQPVGQGALTMTILYNVAYDEVKSPYNSPWVVRMGFNF